MEPPAKKQRLDPAIQHRVALIPRKQALERPHLMFEWARMCIRENVSRAVLTITDTDVKLSQESRGELRQERVPSLAFAVAQKLSQDRKFKSKDRDVAVALRAYGAIRGCLDLVEDHRLRPGEYVEACLVFSGFDRRSRWFEVTELLRKGANAPRPM